MQFTTLTLAALASLATAQKTHVVTVGMNATLTYSPNSLTGVAAGDLVQFQFKAGNHTVTQSTFDKPCEPISMNSNITGFHSGFQPVAASAAMGMIPTYTIMVNNTNPIWIYCAKEMHCEKGMVMVINENPTANSSRTLAAYKAAANSTAATILPGGESATGTGGTGGTTPGTADSAPGASGSPTAGAGMLAAPSTLILVAAAGLATFFL
ncbi:hypothetical protein B0H66DRAFT_345302 [Apodospora peruviana]|uniref:Cupredoxin n=1 Tax=Apodospora peruviana TaxID=516989 RepID=A0AAE0HZ15_9PEZI|nr:hypothetical protein B0H66DRAFT_345302 [Apodospora peruviana]